MSDPLDETYSLGIQFLGTALAHLDRVDVTNVTTGVLTVIIMNGAPTGNVAIASANDVYRVSIGVKNIGVASGTLTMRLFDGVYYDETRQVALPAGGTSMPLQFPYAVQPPQEVVICEGGTNVCFVMPAANKSWTIEVGHL